MYAAEITIRKALRAGTAWSRRGHPGRDRDKNDRRSHDDASQIRERTPHPVGGTSGGEADRRRAGTAHDRR